MLWCISVTFCFCIGINCLFYGYMHAKIKKSIYTEFDTNKTFPLKQETKTFPLKQETTEHSLLRMSLRKFKEYEPKCPCPPVGLKGRQALNRTALSFEELNLVYSFMEDGHYRPPCKPYQKIAIIVPYRDRESQLKVFLNNVIPRILRQKQEFGIYLVEQADNNPFNRGMLSNIGFVHAVQDYQYDCIVIHDVDILPENDRNLYVCDEKSAFHLAGKVEKFNYSVPYQAFFGGISSLSKHQYERINGFSNLFFGWGAEDDDFLRRLANARCKVIRPFKAFSHCGSIEHEAAPRSKQRLEVLRKTKYRSKKDGLNSMNYKLIKKEKTKLFVRIYASISMSVLSEAGIKVPLETKKPKN